MDPLATLQQAARSALVAAGALAEGWDVSGVRRQDARCVVLELHRPDDPAAPGVGVEWLELDPAADPPPAFRRGDRYAASYRRGPGLADLDEGATDEALRRLAHAVCEVLAELQGGPSLIATAPVASDLAAEVWTVEALALALEAALRRDLGSPALANPEGWELQEVRVFQRWAMVAEVLLRRPDRALAFIVTPRDDERPAFTRTRRLDLVYYSDDLPASEHDALYARDRATIDRVAAWLSGWDGDAG